MTHPRHTTAWNRLVPASTLAATGSSKAPGTWWISTRLPASPSSASRRVQPASSSSTIFALNRAATTATWASGGISRGTNFGACVLMAGLSRGSRSLSLAARRSSLRPARGHRLFRLFHPHRLDVHELADSFAGELAAVAAVLDAAEGEAGVGLDDAVDEDAAGLDVAGETFGPTDVRRPDARAQAVTGPVRQLHGVPLVVCD